jgi:hypothetical protein
MSKEQFPYWVTPPDHRPRPGRGAGFSLEGPTGFRFLIRSRLFTDEESAELATRRGWFPQLRPSGSGRLDPGRGRVRRLVLGGDQAREFRDPAPVPSSQSPSVRSGLAGPVQSLRSSTHTVEGCVVLLPVNPFNPAAAYGFRPRTRMPMRSITARERTL